jgi:hypothetical protein
MLIKVNTFSIMMTCLDFPVQDEDPYNFEEDSSAEMDFIRKGSY